MFQRPLLPALLAASVLAGACALDTDPAEDLGETEAELGFVNPGGVDVALMGNNIHDDLGGNVVGYAFAIRRTGVLVRTGSGGLAQRPVDGQRTMLSTRRMQVASVSKTLAAVATLKLLEELGLSVDSPVHPWLPDTWDLGPGWTGRNAITFRDLLTHRTGLNQLWATLSDAEREPWGNDWDGLEYVVSLGATHNAPASYKNANFALLRVIIPALWQAAPSSPGIPWVNEASHAIWHLAYMQQHIFAPAGVDAAGCWEQDGVVTAYLYDINDPDEAGSPAETSFAGCGGHAGWHLSARDLAAVMAKMRWDNDYFSAANRQLMDTGKLGWSSLSNTNSNGRQGKYWHGGDWYKGSGREGHSCVMKFPDGVEASLLINSATPKGACTVLKDAFNDAI